MTMKKLLLLLIWILAINIYSQERPKKFTQKKVNDSIYVVNDTSYMLIRKDSIYDKESKTYQRYKAYLTITKKDFIKKTKN